MLCDCRHDRLNVVVAEVLSDFLKGVRNIIDLAVDGLVHPGNVVAELGGHPLTLVLEEKLQLFPEPVQDCDNRHHRIVLLIGYPGVAMCDVDGLFDGHLMPLFIDDRLARCCAAADLVALPGQRLREKPHHPGGRWPWSSRS